MRHITVFEYERGLKYVEGRFKQVLPPGRYWLGWWGKTTILKVDIRPQYIAVPGQAILTADGVGVKVSLTAVYEIADPAQAINGVASYYQALYLTLQNALRDGVAAIAIDDLVSNSAQLNPMLLAACGEPLASLGLRLISVNVKDVMLPGDLKRLYAQVIQARQEGLAQLERARGETAALRSLANAARLANDNPALLKLRLLQALEQSQGNQFTIGLSAAPASEASETSEIL
ncbi:MAG: slipin family protein [Leptolyngbya sp.]|nr:slipin family protein [Leptolyngbya sp.]